ncbi:cob(I)yrinic acid a,c-diamide adenosyltransferase [Magnetospira sp. QH-2]|uniref:cob(I)yrinic acid a,c-diamide adenosyltransferase n=1 Tax=Magnetospira sp. (strain QH-2) TaxID=1288970 RepID=UPI0003E8178C|nr:cob(I)yrinic acid a,c-diamide adenosyltransferase [Magnetospira sp. QH-2]CCQ74934.1 Cob(I)yrinic acid a,c-diamide adenosyltransferase [Magnetospira sp. QH-2]
MVWLSKIYTRTGDHGTTALGNGAKVDKHDLRVEAYGTIDEANAIIGLARLYTGGEVDHLMARIQNELFDLGADLCTPIPKDGKDKHLRITGNQVLALERDIDVYNSLLEPLNSFVLPGGAASAARLHYARTVVRRAERCMTSLAAVEDLNPEALKYVNRLSDLLFVLSRHLNDNGKADILWKPGETAE